MLILTYLAHALGCALLVNAIPHCVNGLSGKPFKARSPARPVWVSLHRW